MVRQRFKPFQKAKEAKDFWDNAQKPQEGLVPLFNSPFYATPDEPADPTDCNRYPDSPYCGGNPLTAKFAPSIELSMVRDECNLGIQFDGSFAFIKAPPVQIVYRNPNCIPEPPEEPEPEPPSIPDEITPALLPPNYCGEGNHLCLVWTSYSRTILGKEGDDYWNDQKWTTKIQSVIPSIIFPEISLEEPGILITVKWERFASGRADNRNFKYKEESFRVFVIHQNIRERSRTGDSPVVYTPLYSKLIPYKNNWEDLYPHELDVALFDGTYERLTEIMETNPNRKHIDSFGRIFISQYASGIYCLPYNRNNSPPPPKYMCCCPNVEQNDQLLRLILKRIGEPKEVTIFDEDLNRKGAQKAKKTPESLNDYLKLAVERVEIANRIIGVENFPITVPDTMIEPYKEGAFSKIFGFINGDKKRKIQTIAEFIAWMSEQDSAVLGEFHQVIEYESGEKGKNGKPKTQTIVLPNVAEALKEITLLVTQMAKQNNVQTEVLFKALFEIVATRAEATKGTAIVQDIQDFLDYPTEAKAVEYSSTISIPNFQVDKSGKPIATQATEDHKNLLQPGKIKYVYEDWTGDSSLHDQLLDLLQLASMMRAVFYQRTDK